MVLIEMELTNTQKDVLASFVMGALNKYEVARRLGKSYSVVYNAIKSLLDSGLIEVVKTQSGAKNPKIEVEYYGLTLLGLAVTLATGNFWNSLDEIIGRWKHLHPLLGKWQYLNEILPRSMLLASLQTTVEAIHGVWSVKPNHELLRDGGKNYFYETFLTPIIGAPLPLSEQEMRKWIEAIRGDAELKQYIIKKLTETNDKMRAELEYREKLFKRIKGELD